MSEQASFKLRNRNPDILSCIANLSNDEVFTPPELANHMLDMLTRAWAKDNGGANIWEDTNVKFLDPCAKSGIFLREITARLTIGLEKKIPNLEKRVDHILSKQVFGLGITKLTSLLARRSIYCSKNADGEHSIAKSLKSKDGNIWYENCSHEWVNGKCKYCGASKKIFDRSKSFESHAYAFIHSDDINKRINQIFGGNMQFDVIIGNPPYQLSDGGAQSSAMPIYQKFVTQAKELDPNYLVMVIPSRWFSGGKGLDDFRTSMLRDKSISEIHDFLDASDCFPNVEIKGGVCYFLRNKNNKSLCKVSTYKSNKLISSMSRPLAEEGLDFLIRYNDAIPILKKIKSKNEPSFSSIVSSRKPFGLATNFNEFNTKNSNSLRIYANKKDGFVDSNKITVNLDWISRHKIYVPYAIGSGDSKTDRIKPFYGEPKSCCTETYLVIGPFDSKSICENVISYMETKFFHFCVTLKKNTQHITKPIYQLVPMQDFSVKWTDELLYKKYNLSQEEIAFIDSMIGKI